MRRLHPLEAEPMKMLPWRISGARLHLPRDLEVTYVLGRMGAATVTDTYRLWFGSPHTARFGFGRLVRLGLLRSFPRQDPLSPAWFSLTTRAVEWVAEEAGCDPRELRALAGVRNFNLPALSARNRLWTSLMLACRNQPSVGIVIFQPEWELRPMKSESVPIIPDAITVLENREVTDVHPRALILEMDTGSERSAVWKSKASKYAELRGHGPLYGLADWRLVALVPSVRRACTVARAVVSGGAGAFTFLGVISALENGRAFSRVLYPAPAIAVSVTVTPSASLVDELATPISEADQQPRPTGDRGLSSETGRISP
jgi:hypothetical protein